MEQKNHVFRMPWRLVLTCLAVAVALQAPVSAETDANAREVARLERLERIGELSARDAMALRNVSKAPDEILLRSGGTLAQHLKQHRGVPVFDLLWTSVTSAGGSAEGGPFALDGASGAITGTAQGSGYELASGFVLAGTDSAPLFADGFDLGNLQSWSSVVGQIP